MRTEAGKMPESLIFPIRNGLGASNDRFGFNSALEIFLLGGAGLLPRDLHIEVGKISIFEFPMIGIGLFKLYRI